MTPPPDHDESVISRREFGQLLGEWRDTAAYRPLARLLALEEEEVEGILGDVVPETVPRIMAPVFDGDPPPLYARGRRGKGRKAGPVAKGR